ncbi:MAG: hypothetical protein Kapaf2KO_23450 [Candidatus Kapaibacteriales bacterium]
MPELIVESNGRLEKTAVYLNGEQLSGIKELLVNMDEEGTFDALLVYNGGDGQLYTKSIFTDYLTAVKVTPPTFTEDDAQNLEQLVIQSEGDIEETLLLWNEEELGGVISLYIHIKAQEGDPKGIMDRIMGKKKPTFGVECKAEITFRDEDDSIYTETVF